MNTHKIQLLCIAFFTLLFIALVALGYYLLSIGSKQFAVASFLFAFAAVIGHIASLALYLRHKVRIMAAKEQMKNAHQGNPHV